jgi:hypothetical protein
MMTKGCAGNFNSSDEQWLEAKRVACLHALNRSMPCCFAPSVCSMRGVCDTGLVCDAVCMVMHHDDADAEQSLHTEASPLAPGPSPPASDAAIPANNRPQRHHASIISRHHVLSPLVSVAAARSHCIWRTTLLKTRVLLRLHTAGLDFVAGPCCTFRPRERGGFR